MILLRISPCNNVTGVCDNVIVCNSACITLQWLPKVCTCPNAVQVIIKHFNDFLGKNKLVAIKQLVGMVIVMTVTVVSSFTFSSLDHLAIHSGVVEGVRFLQPTIRIEDVIR
jgi:hypothetical protein